MAEPVINIKILTDLKTLNTSLDSAAKRINTWSTTSIGGFLEFGKAIAGVTVRLGAMAAPFVGVGLGVFKLAKSTADAEEQLGKMGKRLGMSVEDLSKFKNIAFLADSSIDELVSRLSLLSNRVTDASKGVGDSAKLFKLMGIEVVDSSGHIRNMTNILLDISTKFHSYTDDAAKVSLANELMGRGGSEFIVVFEKIFQTFSKTKATITEPMAEAANKFNDQLKLMSLNAQALKISAGNNLIPPLTKLLEVLVKLSEVRPNLGSGSWKEFFETMNEGTKKALENRWTGSSGNFHVPAGESPRISGANVFSSFMPGIDTRALGFEGSQGKTQAPSTPGESGNWVDRAGNMEKLVDDMAMKIDKQISAKEDMIRNTIGMKLMRAIGDGMIFSGERTISDVLTNLFTGEKVVPMDIVRSFGKLIGRTLGDSLAAAAMQPLKSFLATLFGAGGSAFTSFFSASGGFTGFSSGGAPATSSIPGSLTDVFKYNPLGRDPRKTHNPPGRDPKGININIGSGYSPREIGDMVSRELQDSYGRNSGVRKVIKSQR